MDTSGCAAWLTWCNHSVIPEQLAASEAVLQSVIAFTVSHLVTDTAPWEGGTSGEADYHFPGVAVLLCAQIKPWGPLGQEGIFLLAKHTESFVILSFWNVLHFAGILNFA